ncbi:hypothetical protein RB6434 [Rhodopirellula baltica SH 1]|uniref:Uncharacterized protein n=1 Tax=Rhodopirellula baltica (strain DSM 10527 / NCIMB 13988 / SH1) TaxID=243090 RepID=Q7UQA6_RHOBA|nr:hypothetical protein RB6434 [Rhodopirellula baltica SH 1]
MPHASHRLCRALRLTRSSATQAQPSCVDSPDQDASSPEAGFVVIWLAA